MPHPSAAFDHLAFDFNAFDVTHGVVPDIIDTGADAGSGGRWKHQPPDPWWWRSPYEYEEEEFTPPSPEEVEAAQRKASERKRRIEAHKQALLDQAESRELRTAARDANRPYDDRFANAFKLASKGGRKWQ